jgi:hypothetical protein
MKQFLRMIEVAKLRGVHYLDGVQPRGLDASAMDNNFWKRVEECEVFVFTPKDAEPSDLASQTLIREGKTEGDPEVMALRYPQLDAPFKAFSYEMLGDCDITVPKLFDQVPITIKCVMVWELAPKKYCYYMLAVVHDREMVITTATLGELTKSFLDRLGPEKSGLELRRDRVTIGQGKAKRKHTIRRLFHIVPKGKIIEYEGQGTGRTIEWTHRVSVRGHWRTHWLDKATGTVDMGVIGKCREGCPCVAGHSWVNEHARGPEHLPLIKKVRLVKEETADEG